MEAEQLMERLKEDDEGALSSLVAAFAPVLLRFASRTLGVHAHEAEDVVQEVFVRTWRARHRWQPSASVKTYLFTIATRLCLNRLRGFGRTPPHEQIPEDGSISCTSPDPEREAASRQLGAMLASELAALPASQRAALLLRCESGLSYAEIAAALDTSASAVESLLTRARARLRTRLADATAGTAAGRG